MGRTEEVEMRRLADDSRDDYDDDDDYFDGGGGGPRNNNTGVHASAAGRRPPVVVPSCRSTLLGVFGILILLATYEYAFDRGVREQHEASGTSWTGGSGVVPRGDHDEKDDDHDDHEEEEEDHPSVSSSESDLPSGRGGDDVLLPPAARRTFTEGMLRDTRDSARSLIDELDGYYGGRERTNDMLVKSWQAQWMLDIDPSSYSDGSVGPNEDDDDDDEKDEDEDDGGRRRPRRRTKKKKKEGKALVDPDNMSPDELEIHDVRRRQRTSKLVMTMARAVLDPTRESFVIGTIGSSVAAGHDNCHYDSYESQLERTLAPVFVSAGMSTMVQNAGEGGGCGDNHMNQVYCVTHNLSPDVDVVHYSWTYFEKGGAEEQREMLIRWAQRMDRRPMVHHLVARGLKNTCNGDVRANVDLDDAYAIYGYNAFCIQTGLYFGGHDYDTEMEGDGINRFGWQYRGDGYHNTTRYGESLPVDDPRRGSLGTVYRNWHPGPMGFQIASDAFAYVYASGLLIALDIIEGDMKAGLNALDRWFDSDRRLEGEEAEWTEGGRTARFRSRTTSSRSHPPSLRHRRLPRLPPLDDMPEPLFCDPLYCSVPHPPSCLNYELPTFGPPGIAVRDRSNWTVWHEDNDWSYMVGKVDRAIIKAMHDPEWEKKCAHLDACGGITASDSTHGTLTYDLPASRMSAGLIFVCGYPGKEVDANILQNTRVVFKLNGRVLDKSTMDLYPNQKCVRLLKRFGDGGHEREDTMLLSVEIVDIDPNGESKPPAVMISHVVAL